MPFDNLQKPLSLGDGLELRNRVIMASLTRNRAVPADFASEAIKEYYTDRAAGGCGLILSEGTLISPQGTEWPNVASIYDKYHAQAWKQSVDGVHSAGGKIFAQLWHVGRVAHPDMPLQKGNPVSAPSPIRARGGKFRLLNDEENATPSQEHPDPWKLVEEYRNAAKQAKAAGFDGVEAHFANGYLIAQFLDSNSNKRTDEWGGDVNGRTKLAKEVLAALLETYPAHAIGIKLNPCGGFNDVGMNEADTKETFSEVINHAVKLGLGYIQLVRYLPFMDGEYDGKKRAETHLDVFETFTPLIKGSSTKVFVNGDFSPEEADKFIEEGKADAVVFGRPWISNPDYAKRIFQGLPLNEELGHPDNPKTWYAYGNDPNEGYNDFPSYEKAKKEKN